MKLYSIHAGNFKLDGGAMFGVVPKVIWEKLNPPDDKNLCEWSMRCLLIDTGDRKILIDNGIGDKQDEKFFKNYQPHGPDYSLEKNLKAHGFTPEDITDNLLTHLHFDHCGGGIKWNQEKEEHEPTFPNATYHVSRPQWESAQNPNPREKASMLKENIFPMQEKGKLNIIEEEGEFLPGIDLSFVYGHTDGMILPKIQYGNHTVVYMADLLPSHMHMPIPFVMAFDIRPLDTMPEKEKWLQKALEENWVLFFEHDPFIECCTVQEGKKYIEAGEKFELTDLSS